MKKISAASPSADFGTMRLSPVGPSRGAGGGASTSGSSGSSDSERTAWLGRVRPIGRDRTQRYDQLMLALMVVLFIAELYVMVVVAGEIGVLNTVGLLIVIAVLGIWLVKRQGLAVLRRMRSTVDAGQVPAREVIDGFLILFAGLLLIPPGFITDAAGLLLLLPPVRALIRVWLFKSLARRGSLAIRIVDGV